MELDCTHGTGREGVAYTVVPSSNGGLLKLTAIRFPRPQEQPFPDLASDQSYYKGMNPDLGMLIAEEHTPGETWVFQIGDRLITDDSGFHPGVTEIAYTCHHGDDWYKNGAITAMNGFWAYLVCNDIPRLAFGPTSAKQEELLREWQDYILVQVPIPENVGLFFGYAHSIGEVWTVDVDGVTYTATATDANLPPDSSEETETYSEDTTGDS